MNGQKKPPLDVLKRIRQVEALRKFLDEMASHIELAGRLGAMDVLRMGWAGQYGRSVDDLQSAFLASAMPVLAKGGFASDGFMSFCGCLRALRTPGSRFVTLLADQDDALCWGIVVDADENCLATLRTSTPNVV